MPFFVKTDSLFLSTPSARRATHICVGKRGEVWDFYPRPPRGGRPRPDPLWTGCRRNFYPRPPRGGRRSAVRGATWRIFYFYPRPPRGGRPDTDGAQIGFICISIHALREEGDVHTVDPISHFRRFLSTPSARRATFFGSNLFCFCFNFYPRPPRGGRPEASIAPVASSKISIHALREEGDLNLPAVLINHKIFLSTPSARRATAKTEKNISAFVSL